jgi:hypothetical protein
MSFTGKYAYLYAALWAAVITFVGWACVYLPFSDSQEHGGSMSWAQSGTMGLGTIIVRPGIILFQAPVHWLLPHAHVGMMQDIHMFASFGLPVWLFYFGLFSLIAFIRRRWVRRRASHLR